MNLFRSEAHARRWFGYDPTVTEGTMPLRQWVQVFSVPRYRTRLEPNYVLMRETLRPTHIEVLEQVRAELRAGGYWDEGSSSAHS